MVDLKNNKVSIEERAKNLIKELGISEDTAVNAMSLKKGDTFKLTGMQKVGTPTDTFQPMVFTTNRGAQIGTKHFASVDLDDDNAPVLGRTALEVAKYCTYCVEKDIEFTVRKIDILDERPVPNGRPDEKYSPKVFHLEVV